MSFAPLYLLNRFFFRLSDFFHHWYIDGSRQFARSFIGFLAALDRVFAVRITFYLFWKPLYGDYTVIGRILGVIFRFFRLIIALILYAAVAAAALVLYILWLSIPFIPLFLAYRALISFSA